MPPAPIRTCAKCAEKEADNQALLRERSEKNEEIAGWEKRWKNDSVSMENQQELASVRLRLRDAIKGKNKAIIEKNALKEEKKEL
ncbi:unnamed protein product, partial [Amoebophrya sp. A120]|eukprot:GSA120T00020931001.1